MAKRAQRGAGSEWRRELRGAAWWMGLLIALLGSTASASVARSQHLFDIERSKNANVVRYDLRVLEGGGYEPRRPIDVYWVRYAEQGQRRELKPLERRLAYGYKVHDGATADRLTISFVAVRERPLLIRRTEAGYRPEIMIAGEPSQLHRVYVRTLEGRAIPKVLYLELHGTSLSSGKPTSERLDPS